jgi:hypothetical protein
MIGFLTSTFISPLWLVTLLFALITLILYLIRPRPKKQDIPALMFIVKESERAKSGSWLKKLLLDPLLLLQLATLILLTLALAQPIIQVNQKATIDKTAIIIDGSASMLAREGTSTRFDQAKNIAQDYLTSKNFIILAGDVALALDDDLSRLEAKDVLASLEPTHTRTNLAEAIDLAAANLGKGSQIVIVSDFIETKLHADYLSAIAKAKAQGIHVITKRVGSPITDNVGIIAMQAGLPTSVIQIKNYKDEETTVHLDLAGLEQNVEVPAKGTEVVEFETPSGITKIRIKDSDAFPIDNEVYLSNYPEKTIRVLVISNEEEDSQSLKYLKTALDVNEELTVEYQTPPKVDVNGYDVIIIKDVNPTALLPRTIKEITQQVEQGTALIAFAQPGLFSLNLPLPVTYKDQGGQTPVIVLETLGFVRDINFGMVPSHMIVEKDPQAVVIAQSEEESPLIAYKDVGEGRVLYYGLQNDEFHLDIYYPIFWKRAIDFLIGREELSRINLRTGALLNFASPVQVKTPTGTKTTQIVYFDRVGTYQIEDTTYSANLLSEKESDLTKDVDVSEEMIFSTKEYEDKVPKEIANTLLILALFLAGIEVLVLKLRGEF